LADFLYELSLNKNQLTGDIPSEIGMLHFLKYLDLSENKLSGPIPIDIENINAFGLLVALLLYSNDLTGNIPVAIDDPIIPIISIDCGEITCVNCVDKGGVQC
jgi:hypothetical protein